MPDRRLILTDGVGTKSIELTQYPDSSWTWYSGRPVDPNAFDPGKVAFVYRGITQLANLAASIPFSIMQGKREIDNSATWTNALGFLPHPKRLNYKIAAAYIAFGTSYVLPENIAGGGTKNFKYLVPSTITPKIDANQGLTGFERNIGTQTIRYKPDELIYFWLPDHNVEIGPPVWYPLRAILSPGELIFFTQQFASSFMSKGAIKATLFAVPVGTPDSDKQRFESRWKRMMQGAKNAFNMMVIEADSVKPQVVGEGLEALKDAGAIARSREDIAAGLGMSLSMLLSNAANFATAMADRKNIYENVIIPLMENIAGDFNEQFYEPRKLKMELHPEGLNAFQDDKNLLADSTKLISDILTADPKVFLISTSITGYPLKEEDKLAIKQLIADKEAKAEEIAQTTANAQAQPQQPPQEQPPQEPPQDMPTKVDLYRWQQKSEKHFTKNGVADVPFQSDHIPAEQQVNIHDKLKQCATIEAIKAAFAIAPEPDQTPAQILEAIRLGVAAIKYNENHDELGRFSSEGGGTSGAEGINGGGGGGGEVSGTGGGIPDGHVDGHTVRTIKGKKVVVEDAVNQALDDAKNTPENRLRTNRAETLLRQEGRKELQKEENKQAMNEYRQGKQITESDVQLTQADIISGARQMDYVEKFNKYSGSFMNPDTQFLQIDFSTPQTIFNGTMSALDRRTASIHRQWTLRQKH